MPDATAATPADDGRIMTTTGSAPAGGLESAPDLRRLYPEASGRVTKKVLPHLDHHARHFIELSPFCVLATVSATTGPEVSPRGGDPGFVTVVDPTTLHLPDRPGNNRLDTLSNLVSNAALAMLFLVPGIDETLRVYGRATVVPGPGAAGPAPGRRPSRSSLVVSVDRAFFHCAKAPMRANLWDEDAKVPRSRFPTLGEILKEQTQDPEPAESQDAMLDRYRDLL